MGFVLIAAILWHILAILAPPQQAPKAGSEGRDYASYHYAAHAAQAGDNPWDLDRIEAAAREEGTRTWLHPYLYPAPFLLLVWPFAQLSLGNAFLAWGLFQELALVAAALALAWGWRGVHGAVGVVFVALAALMYGVAYGVELGQANVLVLALVLSGTTVSPEAPRWGGAALGIACMLKMSPALVVLWWLWRGEWVAARWAIGTGLLVCGLTLPLVGLEHQFAFFTEVLPRFGSGDYNGLSIKIEMFGNHSLASVWHTVTLSKETGDRTLLSPLSRALSAASMLTLFMVMAVAFRDAPAEPAVRAGQLSTVFIAMILVPVYTYEHHLIFALPAMALCLVAIAERQLPRWTAVPLGVAIALLCYPLPDVKAFADGVVTTAWPIAYAFVRESKTLALLAIGSATLWIGRGQSSTIRPEAPAGTTLADTQA